MPFPRGQRPTFGELTAGVAIGFSLWGLAYYGTIDAIGNIRSAFSDEEENELSSPTFEVYQLSFHVGDTEIYYGQTLAALVATAMIALVAVLVLRRRRRALAATCPNCLSPIPVAASVCASCTRDVAPAAP